MAKLGVACELRAAIGAFRCKRQTAFGTELCACVRKRAPALGARHRRSFAAFVTNRRSRFDVCSAIIAWCVRIAALRAELCVVRVVTPAF